MFESDPHPVNCVKCNNMFLTWLNYETLFPGSGLPVSDPDIKNR